MTAKRQSNLRTGADAPVLRAAIYARISLDKVGEAAGVGRQIDACRHLADLEGWTVDEVLVDNDQSASSGTCRPNYERLLDLVRRREIDVIVAYHPDRLYRRLADLVELTKVVPSAGVEIRTVAAGHVDLNTTSGRFTAQVLGAAAEHESGRIANGQRQAPSEHRAGHHAAFIWSIADLLRGDYTQSGYRKVILPPVVLRRLDCVLEPTKAKVLAEHAKPGVVKTLFDPACGISGIAVGRRGLRALHPPGGPGSRCTARS